MNKGILSSELVDRAKKYFEEEKIVRNIPEVKFILEVFPKSTIVSYKRKKRWDY